MTWAIRYAREAERALDSLDPQVRRRVTPAIGRLAVDPRNSPNVKALRGNATYRLRVGDWRVIYALLDDELVISVLRIVPSTRRLPVTCSAQVGINLSRHRATADRTG